jgi:uncharacterized protein YtpQ (UPF0354 family)
MKRLIQAALAALGLCSGCSKSDVLTPTQFTSEFAQELRKASPELRVEVVKDMELKVTTADGRESTSFLDNAYDLYMQDPKSKEDIFEKYVAASLETIASLQTSEVLDRMRIVPVIKDRPWLEETRNAMIARGAKDMFENIHEDLNSDLIILYAEDSPKNMRYFGPKDLEKANIQRSELRKLACENLQRLLPEIERHGRNGLFMIVAGGDYEASLLLLDSIWDDIKKEVRGDVVVAIPSRDLLIVTGSEDSQGIEKVKKMVENSFAQGAYRLTKKLFVFHESKLEEFKQ